MGSCKWVILACLMMAGGTWGQVEEFVNGEGKFYAQEDDDPNFIKQQLIYQATLEVITFALKSMNYSPEEFWRIYEERFTAHFAPVKEKLLQDFKIASAADGAKNASFQKALRVRQLTAKSNFGRLERVMLSYKIDKMSRATNSPNLRFISIRAKVDRKFLHELYSSYTKKSDHQTYALLYVSLELDLSQFSGDEFGMFASGEWEKSILESWQKTLAAEISTQLAEKVQIASGDLELGRLQKILSDEELENALWLQVKIKLGQKMTENSWSKVNLRFSGSSFLHDLTNKKMLFFEDFNGEIKGIATNDQKQLSQQVASTISQLPAASFRNMEKQLATRSSGERTFTIRVQGHRSIQDVFDLQQVLAQEGVHLQLQTSLPFFTLENALVGISSIGTPEVFQDFWQKVAGKSINANLQINVDVLAEQVLIRLK